MPKILGPASEADVMDVDTAPPLILIIVKRVTKHDKRTIVFIPLSNKNSTCFGIDTYVIFIFTDHFQVKEQCIIYFSRFGIR